MKTFEFKKFAVVLFAGLLCLCAHSQTFDVTTTADSGPGSLRDAMTNAIAAGGGTIVFSNMSGTISLQSALPDITVDLTIFGNGPEHVTIDGNQLNRFFHIAPGTICDISGLNLQRGLAPTNGAPFYLRAAILNEGSLSLSNCFLHDNGPPPTFPPGIIGAGALASSGERLVLNYVIISNNYSRVPAGLSASNVRATNCLFIKNRTDDGAPISAGDSVFNDCTFTQNTAWLTGEGGGISGWGNLTLLNCYITNNLGDYGVNGIKFNGINLVISNSVINNNTGSSHISAIKATGNNIVLLNSSICGNYSYGSYGIQLDGNAYLSGCTISSNANGSAFNSGISIIGTLSLTNCTISGNKSTHNPGSAIEVGDISTTVQAVNCTIAFNGSGVQNISKGTFYALNTIIANNGTDFSGILTSQGYNLIGNPDANTVIVGSTDGNIYGVDPLLGPLQNNGGLTPTHALIRGSPAIDAGSKDGAPFDQRGVARPYGDGVDIGAFESEYHLLRFTDISRVNTTDIHLQLVGLPGSTCTIQTSSNFLEWENVFTSDNGLTGILEFVDQDAANHPTRFYRALTDN